MNRPITKIHGFTLLELMVSLSVVATLLVLAAPSWREQTAKNQLIATTNKLVGAMAYTRSEAVNRGVQTTLCSSNDLSNASPSCTASDWQDGWLVWADMDNDSTLDSPGEIVRVSEPVGGSVAITPSATTLAFDTSGFTTSPGTFLVCDDRGGDTGRQIRLLVSGSTSLTTEVTCP